MQLASGIEGSLLRGDPSPAYGSEFSTDGNRLVRAMEGNGTGCRFTPGPILQDKGPFPVSSTAPHYRRIKSERQERIFASGYKNENCAR